MGDYPDVGVELKRVFTEAGQGEPEANWVNVDAEIPGSGFKQTGCLFPDTWSQNAVNIVASKYFRGQVGDIDREFSLRQVLNRVVMSIGRWGDSGGYFSSGKDVQTFQDELYFILLNQMAAFNSPVWFNCGMYESPQVSACFINSVEDNMESILELAKTEGLLFRHGSGTGTNFSTLRSSHERLTGGGYSSGPLSFMRGYDSFAGAIKSGGKTRRSAKMVILNIGHPDIPEFIKCKAEEEKKAWALIDGGYSGEFDGEAYRSVFFQNSNNSVRVPDEFMEAVLKDYTWETRKQNGEVHEVYSAKDLFRQISEAAYLCGDPGIQFDDTINDWHTCPNTDRIYASNPCSEFMFLDDTACNLASINLLKFLGDNGEFQTEAFKHTVRVLILAQEIMVSQASYPTPKIEKNSHRFRPLGLGYANLGALLMAMGLAYDSPEGRDVAGSVTAIMTGHAYKTSADIAKVTGAFKGYEENRREMEGIICKHQEAAAHLTDGYLADEARECWKRAMDVGHSHGFRNSQVTVIAPTGTISFMMDCDTTGIEPELSLVKYKRLDGGGTIEMVNATVPRGLKALGYDDDNIAIITEGVANGASILGLNQEHLSVFATSFGENSIHWSGHIKMMAAVQPFLSGAISKTINMPNESTVEDIEEAYMMGWEEGCKSVAIYRDGCKRTQPMNAGDADIKKVIPHVVLEEGRRRLPNERQSITHKFTIGGQHEGYLTVGMFEDGSPGEIFVVMSKEGSTLSGLMDAFATAVSLGLQHGIPLASLVEKFTHSRFEPSGFTGNPDVPIAKSIVDYIFRWLEVKFLAPRPSPLAPIGDEAGLVVEEQVVYSGEFCPDCGAMMMRAGSCYSCPECGSSTGCG
jgi:ribonucleoside-diphosphate reductase alpha chain